MERVLQTDSEDAAQSMLIIYLGIIGANWIDNRVDCTIHPEVEHGGPFN